METSIERLKCPSESFKGVNTLFNQCGKSARLIFEHSILDTILLHQPEFKMKQQ